MECLEARAYLTGVPEAYLFLTPGVMEGSAATVTITLSEPSESWVVVNYQTSNGSATAPDDYNSAIGSVTFAPYELSASFPVVTLMDEIEDDLEDFTFELTGASNANLGGTSSRPIQILEDDGGSGSGSGSGAGCGGDNNPFLGAGGGGWSVVEGTNYNYSSIAPRDTLPTCKAPSVDSLVNFEVRWGDGTSNVYGPGATPAHTYDDDNPSGTSQDNYKITVIATYTRSGLLTTRFDVTVQNVMPTAVQDGIDVHEDQGAVEINVLANDTDPSTADLASLSVVGITAPTEGGTLENLGGGQIRFSPGTDFQYLGENELKIIVARYTVRDDDSESAVSEGIINISILGKREQYTATISRVSDGSEEGLVKPKYKVTLSPPAKEDGVIVSWSFAADPHYDLGLPPEQVPPNLHAQANDVGVTGVPLTFNLGESEQFIELEVIEDARTEPDEQAYVKISGSETDDYIVTPAGTGYAMALITDNEWRWFTTVVRQTYTVESHNVDTAPTLPGGDVTWGAHYVNDVGLDYFAVDVVTSIDDEPSNAENEPVLTTVSGRLQFELDPATGVITYANGECTIGGPQTNGDFSSGIEISNSIDNSAAIHTVSITVKPGLSYGGTYEQQASGSLFGVGLNWTRVRTWGQTFGNQHSYTLKAKKGNS